MVPLWLRWSERTTEGEVVLFGMCWNAKAQERQMMGNFGFRNLCVATFSSFTLMLLSAGPQYFETKNFLMFGVFYVMKQSNNV